MPDQLQTLRKVLTPVCSFREISSHSNERVGKVDLDE